MALTDSSNDANPSANMQQQKPTDRREKPLTKVVIRRLPPTIQQDEFLSQISPVPDYDYIYSIRGDFSLGENAFSRVYINFMNPEDVFSFKERFDNYVFLDSKGHEYPAVVEFAAFQKIPKKRNKNKVDPKCGTIESDPFYLEFLESLKQQPQQEEKPEFSYQLTSETKTDVTTPLLEYVKHRHLERQRIREERREERKRRELERKKLKDDGRKKFEERSPAKPVVVKSSTSAKPVSPAKEKDADQAKDKEGEKKVSDKTVYSGGFKSKERKFDERKNFGPKPKYPPKPEKKEYYEKKSEYRPRKDEYKPKYDDYKKDSNYTKKVKKYSERREERKNATKPSEALPENPESTSQASTSKDKVSQQPEDENKAQSTGVPEKPKTEVAKESQYTDDKAKGEKEQIRDKSSDPRVQRRIRNKDRPTMALYQPGMLTKRRQNDGEPEPKDATKEET